MRRFALQWVVLLIWSSGLIGLEAIVHKAVERDQLDAFKVDPIAADQFENTFKGTDPKVGADVKGVLLNLTQGAIYARSKPEFREQLKGLFPKDDAVTEPMLTWVVNRCAQDKVGALSYTYLQIYLPWLCVMFAGLFAESSRKRIAVSKSLACIVCSIGLQVVFLAMLINTLEASDLNAMRDPQLMATMVTAIVGVLVQFVFPAGAHLPQPGAGDSAGSHANS